MYMIVVLSYIHMCVYIKILKKYIITRILMYIYVNKIILINKKIILFQVKVACFYFLQSLFREIYRFVLIEMNPI